MKWRPPYKQSAASRDDIGKRIERVERDMDAALRDAGAVRREAELTARAIRRELGLPAERKEQGSAEDRGRERR